MTAFDNGISPREDIITHKYDIVFIDLFMPEMDGISCCKSYREVDASANTPIIGITGGDSEDEQACLDAGMTDLIYKPFSKSTILNILLEHTNYTPDKNKLEHIDLTPAPCDQRSCFDKQIALENLDGNEEMLPAMINMFIQLQTSLSDDLDRALETKDQQLLQITSHTLKTRSLYVGGAHLNQLSKDVELLCKKEDFETAASQVPQLKSELSRLVNTLNDLN